MQDVFEVLKPPFRYDYYGQKIFDSENNLVLDVRSWGLLQYKENGEMLQDDFGNKVAEGINYISQLAKAKIETSRLRKVIDEALLMAAKAEDGTDRPPALGKGEKKKRVFQKRG